MRLEAAVFDVGGVLLDWDPRHLYRDVFETEAEMDRFLADICTRDWHMQHDAGVPFAETIPAHCGRFPEHAELIRMWEHRYLDMVAGEVPGTVDVLRALHERGTRLYVLSNMPTDVWPQLSAAFDWFDLFDGAVISGAEKVMKPHAAIYEVLHTRFGVDPTTAVFVDDVEANVAAATALGFTGIRFTNATDLRAALLRT